ncbi:MAG TPA: sigma-70 family RNA polymerase sigma factor [Pyrinomonadaceae bacterium]|nr:sigma-70 family RNA polymerase sigma factor [Pyrinomonadaceae bacterium]
MNSGTDSLESLILRARDGDADAYAAVVWRFQDMAVGYGYALLRDFQLAEDAAQEAFLEAYRSLPALRESAAFPGWFRRIVFKHCDRMTRGQRLATVPLQAVEAHTSDESGCVGEMERLEMSERLWEAINELPEHERAATVLYYISGYSQREVAAFLGTPATAVKKRLFSARRRLRGLLLDLLEDGLRERRPSRHDAFAAGVVEILKAASGGDAQRVKALLEQDPRLLGARDRLGNTALILAVDSGHGEVAELLLRAGVKPDIYEAAAIGRTELVAELARGDARILNSYSPEGFTPLALAAHFGHEETVEFLLARGANVNAVSRNELGVTPLHAALYGRRVGAAKLLLARGADVNARRGGKGIPRAGWTALHYAAGYGFVELIAPLLARGAEVNARDEEGRTPLRVALEEGQEEAAETLRRAGGGD